MDRPLRQGLALAALGTLAACEGPPWPAQAPSGVVAPADAGSGADAAAPTGVAFHAMTIAQCARDAQRCAQARGPAGSAGTYLVAFGTGVGATRTREQAMADLYRELRDRSASGGHLVARPQHLDEAEGGSPPIDDGQGRRPGPLEGDALVEASFEMMAIVDREGEITIDSASSSKSCKVALGSLLVSDAGSSSEHCFVVDEARQRPFGRGH